MLHQQTNFLIIRNGINLLIVLLSYGCNPVKRTHQSDIKSESETPIQKERDDLVEKEGKLVKLENVKVPRIYAPGTQERGKNLKGREVIHSDRGALMQLTKGSSDIKIEVNLCVDQVGNVLSVNWDYDKSTPVDSTTISVVINSLKKYKYERDLDAPELECGPYVINVHNHSNK